MEEVPCELVTTVSPTYDFFKNLLLSLLFLFLLLLWLVVLILLSSLLLLLLLLLFLLILLLILLLLLLLLLLLFEVKDDVKADCDDICSDFLFLWWYPNKLLVEISEEEEEAYWLLNDFCFDCSAHAHTQFKKEKINKIYKYK